MSCHWGLAWPQGGLCRAWFGAHIYIIIVWGASEHWRPARGLQAPGTGQPPPVPCPAGLPRLHWTPAFPVLPSGTGPAGAVLRAGRGRDLSRFPSGPPHLPLLAQSGATGAADWGALGAQACGSEIQTQVQTQSHMGGREPLERERWESCVSISSGRQGPVLPPPAPWPSLRLFLCVAGNQNYSQSQSTGRFPVPCPGEQGPFPADRWRPCRGSSVWVQEPGPHPREPGGRWQVPGTQVRNKDLRRLW